MDATQFIEADLIRARRWNGACLTLAAGVLILPVALGLGLRDGMDGVFAPSILLPNAAAALLLAWGVAKRARGPSSSVVLLWVVCALTLALFLSTARVFFPPGERTLYATPQAFWHESARCFSKGCLTVGLLSIWIGVLVYRFTSWPSRRWRSVLSALAGGSAAVMLGFHCDSSSPAHVIVGHLAPGIVVGSVFWGAQELYFRFALATQLPALQGKARNLGRIG